MIRNCLKKYTEIWGRINGPIGTKLDIEPVYTDKYIKTKIKSCQDSVIANFRDEGNSKKLPKEGLPYKGLTLIMLDSFIKTGKKYYPQTHLEECKYKITKKKMEDLINADFDSSSESDNESSSESDNESGSESDSKSDNKVDK